MPATIYIDESGDLGWTLDKPYGNGGSSRFLTISAVVADSDDAAIQPARVMRDMYRAHKWDPSVEKKWVRVNAPARLDFARRASKLSDAGVVKLYAISVRKENVREHLRSDPNLLYNYMLRLLLLEEMSRHDEVLMKPDPRTIKVQSGNSQHEYLQTTLWYELGATTRLHTTPRDSKYDLGIQFADMLAGVVQSSFERRQLEPMKAIAPSLVHKRLFF